MNAKAEKQEDTRRNFDFQVDEDTTVKYYLGIPSSDQIRKADWHYSKVYNKALVDGVATQAEMLDILHRRNILGPEYEKRLEELQTTIAIKITEMQDEKNDVEKAQRALEIRDLRDKLYQWNQRATGPLSNTCEQIAEDAKLEYLTSTAVQAEDKTPVWASFDEFIGEENQRLLLKSRFEVLLWMQGLDADFLEKTPENLVIKELAENQEKQKEAKRLKAAAEESEKMADEAVELAEEAMVSSRRKKRASKKG